MPKTPDMIAAEARIGDVLEHAIPRLSAEAGGDLNAVAKALGIGRTTLWTWRIRLGLSRALAPISQAERR